jgi:transcriptional regulator with XRE-family HTH domain
MEQNFTALSLIAGANLKRLIKNSKLKTQDEFAYEFGTDVRTIGRWVNNGVKNLDTLQQLAAFFDVDVLTFFSA